MFHRKASKRVALFLIGLGLLLWLLSFLTITQPPKGVPSSESIELRELNRGKSETQASRRSHQSLAPTNPLESPTEPPTVIAEASGVIEGRLGRVPLDLAEEAALEPVIPPASPTDIPAFPLPPGARVVRTEIPVTTSTPSGESERTPNAK